ncbi:MAG: exonuclease [Pseudanabaena sp.]
MKANYINDLFYYKDDNGVSLPAVSTILKHTQPPESVVALNNWKRKLGAEADRVSSIKRDRGKVLHQMFKTHLEGKSVPPCSNLVLPFWLSLQTVLPDLTDVQMIEEVVPNYKEGYAGRVDLVARYRSTPCVVELTTADDPKLSAASLYDKPLQAVAYAGAINRFYEDELYGQRIDSALVIVALPDTPAEVFLFNRDHVVDYWQQWKERLEYFLSLPIAC